KSTMIRCLGRALEHYSTLDQGAVYRFSWVLPAARQSRAGIGFAGGAASESSTDTFAYLPDDLVDARIGDELRDHPLLLIPLEHRLPLLTEAAARAPGLVLPDYLRLGQLSAKNRAVFEALLASYHGDYLKVLRHV